MARVRFLGRFQSAETHGRQYRAGDVADLAHARELISWGVAEPVPADTPLTGPSGEQPAEGPEPAKGVSYKHAALANLNAAQRAAESIARDLGVW